MATPRQPARRAGEDGIVFVALVMILVYLVLMATLPIWFSGIIQTISG